MTDGPVTAAVIVAAGRGVRARSAAGPKQYAVVGGRPVVAHTIAAFLAHPSIDCVQVVIHADDTDHYVTAVAGLEPSLKLLGPVHGGATRQASVLAGLEALVAVAPGLVLIHDAARPFVDAATIARVVAALGTDAAAIAASPIADTLKRGDGEKFVAATVSRDDLWRAQTPQGFRFAAILDAHRRAAEDAIATLTDDAAVAEWAGIPVRLIEGAAANVSPQESSQPQPETK